MQLRGTGINIILFSLQVTTFLLWLLPLRQHSDSCYEYCHFPLSVSQAMLPLKCQLIGWLSLFQRLLSYCCFAFLYRSCCHCMVAAFPYKAVSAAQHCCYQHCIAVMVLVAYTVTTGWLLLVATNSNSPRSIASHSCDNAAATALQYCCQRHLCIVLLLLIYCNCHRLIVVSKHFIISLLQVGCFIVVTAHCAVIAVAEIATVHCCWLCIAVHAKLLLPVADCCHLRTFMISLCRCRFLPWQSTFLWTLLWGTSCSQYRCHHCTVTLLNPTLLGHACDDGS